MRLLNINLNNGCNGSLNRLGFTQNFKNIKHEASEIFMDVHTVFQ
jgi:hypothetical protein